MSSKILNLTVNSDKNAHSKIFDNGIYIECDLGHLPKSAIPVFTKVILICLVFSKVELFDRYSLDIL